MAWKEFWAREIALCTVAAHVESYTRRVPKIIGIPLGRAAYFFDGKHVHLYHDEEEMARFGETVRGLVGTDPDIIQRFIASAADYNLRARELLGSNTDFTGDVSGNIVKCLDFYADYLANAVHIPHRLSWVFDSLEQIDPAVRERLALVRKESYFMDLERMLLGLIDARLDELGSKAESRSLFPYEVTAGMPFPSQAELENRKVAWLQRVYDGQGEFTSGDAAISAHRTIDQSAHSDEIIGKPAFAGKVTAKAVVVNTLAELGKIRPGAVLVTKMTTVEFIPHIKDIAGIVTDEGGITCHAAILSREMRIPCIVGTSNATRIIRDGQTVVVDADTGRVTVLN